MRNDSPSAQPPTSSTNTRSQAVATYVLGSESPIAGSSVTVYSRRTGRFDTMFAVEAAGKDEETITKSV